MTTSRLLILTGSAEIAAGGARKTALDHFDGAEFRMVRHHLAECPAAVADSLHILVLTEAGFIGAYERVLPDMLGIDDEQAPELLADKRANKTLFDALDGADAVFISASPAIEEVLGCMMMSRPAGSVDWMRSEIARGSDGRKLNGLLKWLVRTSPDTAERAALAKQAANAVECASDGRLSPASQAVIDGYMADLAACREELAARRALAGVC